MKKPDLSQQAWHVLDYVRSHARLSTDDLADRWFGSGLQELLDKRLVQQVAGDSFKLTPLGEETWNYEG